MPAQTSSEGSGTRDIGSDPLFRHSERRKLSGSDSNSWSLMLSTCRMREREPPDFQMKGLVWFHLVHLGFL